MSKQPPRKQKANRQGIKSLILAGSLAATLTGWTTIALRSQTTDGTTAPTAIVASYTAPVSADQRLSIGQPAAAEPPAQADTADLPAQVSAPTAAPTQPPRQQTAPPTAVSAQRNGMPGSMSGQAPRPAARTRSSR